MPQDLLIEHRLTKIETLLTEVHADVVGQRLPERMAAIEADVKHLAKKQQPPSWRSKAMQTAIPTAIALVAGLFGVRMPSNQ